MWRSKKFIIATVLAAVVLVGSIGGVVLAQENGDEDGTQPEARHAALLERVCEIYEDNTGDEIDSTALKEAWAQAQSEMQAEAMEAHLAKMVENGVIDETQAQELQEWLDDMPEGLPFGPGFRGHGMFPGMGGPPGWGRLPPMPIE
jgi:hypothetical protein